jgi:hypothetical protein
VGLETGLNPPVVAILRKKKRTIFSDKSFSWGVQMMRRWANLSEPSLKTATALDQISPKSVRHTSTQESFHYNITKWNPT